MKDDDWEKYEKDWERDDYVHALLDAYTDLVKFENLERNSPISLTYFDPQNDKSYRMIISVREI